MKDVLWSFALRGHKRGFLMLWVVKVWLTGKTKGKLGGQD